MKFKKNRFSIPLLAIPFLLATVGGICYFSRLSTILRQSIQRDAGADGFRTKASDRAATDTVRERRRHESIELAAQKWYEELLEKYPRMKPTFRDVPDERNGLLHLLLLAESMDKPMFPDELRDKFGSGSGWDGDKFKKWLEQNGAYRNQILRIAELPDQSIKGMNLDRINFKTQIISEFGYILNGSARLAFETGDQESALRYARASISLGGHLTNIEVPSMLGEIIARKSGENMRAAFLDNFMQKLSDDPKALASWRDALVQKEEPASEYARILTGEWNVMIRTITLPELLGADSLPQNADLQFSDAPAFFDAYTSATQNIVANLSKTGPGRVNLFQNDFEFSESGIDSKTLRALGKLGSYNRMIFDGLAVQTTRAAMFSAAMALQLGEEPGLDPVSGKPFQWDPQSRTLALPEGTGGVDPIKLP